MTDRKLIVPALVGVLGMGAIATAAEPTASELREQIEALQSKVAKIEAKEASAAQSQATIATVLNDAERRSQLLQSGGMTGGFDGKEFFLGSADGKFKLVPYFQLQFRGVTNYADEAQADGDASTVQGFELRRTKFGIKGNAFSKELKYDINWAFSRSSGTPTLEKAFVEYKFADEMSIRAGQWKENVFHEESVSSSRQMAADRSLVNEVLGGGQTDYVQGISLLYGNDTINAEISLTDGANSDNTNFNDTADANYGVSGRVEYKFFGDWKSYQDFTSMKNKEDLLVVGGGFDYTEGGSDKRVFHSFDAQYEAGQLALYGAYYGVWAEDGDDDDYLWGAMAQVAYLIDESWEVFGRYGFIEEDSINEITVGVNHYFFGHNAKITVDVVVLPDGSPSDSGLGYVASDELQVVLRSQFQLAL
jgi:hypothetical protein